jgi:ribonuclease Z
VTSLVQSRRINGPFLDPGVFVDFRFIRRALLFDLPDLAALSPRELLRVSDVFVSHAHMDHFFGFDALLRVCLHRSRPLHMVGPHGFAEHVAAKLAGYTWNLLGERSVDFAIIVDEFDDGRIRRRARFAARRAFVRTELEPPPLNAGLVLEEDDFTVAAEILDHGTACLAFALQERRQVNVWRDALDRLGLPVGPWLNEAKRAVRRGDADETQVRVDAARRVRLGELKQALHVAPGQRIAYVVDAAPLEANIERAVRLAHRADRLYVEAPFAGADLELAARRGHLTAAHAGRIAREAGVREVIPFHFSARYLDRPEQIADEVQAAFRGAEG